MKLVLAAFILFSFSAKASPYFSTREQLRLHLWFHGLEEKPDKAQKKIKKKTPLPEELERALRKI